jgi:DNA-binding transcriptional MerR regulator
VELTIQELSARVDMTPRNIREWQTIGVLLPPRRRGRLAFYDERHVTRIERVKSLRADGFPLDVIRQFLEGSQASAADVLTLSATVLDPASQGGSKAVDRSGLAARFGADAEESLIGCGLIEVVDDQTVVIKDVATFDYVEQLAAIGLPVDAIASAVEAMSELQVRGVSALVDLYRNEVWQPFVDAGLPAAQWRSIAEKSGRMRELVLGLGGQTLRQATDIVIGQVAVEQATKLDSRS